MAGGYSDQFDFPSDHDLNQTQHPSIPTPRAPRSTTTQHVDTVHFPTEDDLPHPTPAPNKIYYFKSSRLAALSRQAHVNKDRAVLLSALLNATDLLKSVHVEETRPATIEELQQYHADTQYLTALANYHLFSPRQLALYGLEDDCAPYPGTFEHACLCAGGSIQAAAALTERRCRIAIHLEGGGRHHALKAKAAGFCYINDVILAILRLLSTYRRILYLDIDVHHGDAVEEAFKATDRVLTLSMHHSSLGYFPGTGKYNGTTSDIHSSNSINASNSTNKAGFALNLPLQEGLKDSLFLKAFQKLCSGTAELYRPDCIVLCCGVDGLAHDPIGRAWSLTPAAYGAATAHVASLNLPVLMLGGGGYDSAASCCAFAAALAGISGQNLPEDVPQHQYFDRYGPSYSMLEPGRPSLAPDLNNEVEVETMCDGLLRVLRSAIEQKNASEMQKSAAKAAVRSAGGDGNGAAGLQQGKRMKFAA